MHYRRFVIYSPDFVMAVTLVTFRRMCIAQCADLAVIRTEICFQLFGMAVAAILRNSQPGVRIARGFDVMRGMAVATHGSVRISVHRDFLPMD